MNTVFPKVDFTKFWRTTDYSKESYIGKPVSDKMIKEIQKMYKYRLSNTYIDLLRTQNGGTVNYTCHKAPKNSWSDDHIAITGIYGIDKSKSYSQGGYFRSQFWIDEWGYPDIGLYFAGCPSAGHDMICMDYSECGTTGEPRIVHVDQESNYRVTVIADSIKSFINGLYAEPKR